MEKRRILIATATEMEHRWLKAQIPELAGFECHFLATGIGMVNMALQMGRYCALHQVDIAFNIGIAGAFPGQAEVLDLVQVQTDIFVELGADSPEGFLDLSQMGFPSLKTPSGKSLFNEIPAPGPFHFAIPQAKAISVNRVSGRHEGIQELKSQWGPDIESMEGAAFFQACHAFNVPGYQFRSISNLVLPRDKSTWRIPEAVQKVQEWFLNNVWRPEVLRKLTSNTN